LSPFRRRSRSRKLAQRKGLASYEAPDFTPVPTDVLERERLVIRSAYLRALAASDERACAAASRILTVLDTELAHRGCE